MKPTYITLQEENSQNKQNKNRTKAALRSMQFAICYSGSPTSADKTMGDKCVPLKISSTSFNGQCTQQDRMRFLVELWDYIYYYFKSK